MPRTATDSATSPYETPSVSNSTRAAPARFASMLAAASSRAAAVPSFSCIWAAIE